MPETLLPTVIFYGTPEFAVPSLKIILENNFSIKAVVTAPDKPSGRGMKMQHTAVKQFALENNLNVLQPASLKDPEFLDQLHQIAPDLQIVVAFRKLPPEVWKLPHLGTFNLHASLLPDYRGAAPINWCLINGDQQTGLTTFLINENIDTGSILLSEKVPVAFTDNAGDLHDRLMETGAHLVLQTANGLKNKTITPQIQPSILSDGRLPRPAPKIFKEDCSIDWKKSQTAVYNFIRGLSPYPGAFSELVNEKNELLTVRILSTEIIDFQENRSPGSLYTDGSSFWYVCCGGGWLSIKNAQLPGRKVLNIKDLLNGFSLNNNFSFNYKDSDDKS